MSMLVRSSWFSAVLVALIFAPESAGAAPTTPTPVPVSPGSIDEVSAVESRCPTFQWGAVDGARGYQVVVYRLGDAVLDVEPVLEHELPAGATGWTPALDRCLDRGQQYGWAVRTIGEEDGEWSTPSVFEVPEGPSETEIAEAVEVLRRARDRGRSPAPPTRRSVAPPTPFDGRPAGGGRADADPRRTSAAGGSEPKASIKAIAKGDGFPTDVGVYGRTEGDDSIDAGIFGEASNPTGIGSGVFGIAESPRAVGVHGENDASGVDPSPINSPHGIGVRGESSHPDGIGVYARAFGSEGTGVYVRAGETGVVVNQAGGEDLLRLDASANGSSPDLIEATADDFTVFRVDFGGNLTAISLSADSLDVNTLDIDALTNNIREVTSGGTISQAICSADELLTGGGCECAGGGSALSSGPDGSDAWRCQCPAGNLATVWAVCLKGNPPSE